MRKLIVFNMMSLDGYFEGPNHNLDWHNTDEEFNDFAIEQLDSVGAILFGRVTYEMMAGYWPTPEAVASDPIVAGKMNSIPKIVFSRTLSKADWSNTRLVGGDAAQELPRLKQQPGKDLIVLGSADLATGLMQAGLVDEYRVMVNPVLLGNGTPLFRVSGGPVRLTLLKTRTFGNGNILLHYSPAGKQ